MVTTAPTFTVVVDAFRSDLVGGDSLRVRTW
jgi:hypothetical protein